MKQQDVMPVISSLLWKSQNQIDDQLAIILNRINICNRVSIFL